MVEDEIVSPRLRGVECYVLTTRTHPEERSGQWRTYAGGARSERFPQQPLRPWQGCQLQGLGLEPVRRAPPPTTTPGELPWLWRDMDLKTLLWERRRGPKVKVYLSGSPAAPADRRLPLGYRSCLRPRLRLRPTLQLKDLSSRQ